MDDKSKNKGGRPKAKIDLNLVEQLAIIQCTDEEMADCLGVDVRTITRKKAQKSSGFVYAYKKGKSNGKTSLRRHQWLTAKGVPYRVWKCHIKQKILVINDCAESIEKKKKGCVDCEGPEEATIYKGSATMQIWLGKQWLSQSEPKELEALPDNEGIKAYDEFEKKHKS